MVYTKIDELRSRLLMIQMPLMYDTDAVDVCYRCRLCMIQMPLMYATDAVYV